MPCANDWTSDPVPVWTIPYSFMFFDIKVFEMDMTRENTINPIVREQIDQIFSDIGMNRLEFFDSSVFFFRKFNV